MSNGHKITKRHKIVLGTSVFVIVAASVLAVTIVPMQLNIQREKHHISTAYGHVQTPKGLKLVDSQFSRQDVPGRREKGPTKYSLWTYRYVPTEANVKISSAREALAAALTNAHMNVLNDEDTFLRALDQSEAQGITVTADLTAAPDKVQLGTEAPLNQIIVKATMYAR